MSDATRHNFAPEGSGSSGLSRRQIIRAGVWAAPVVVLATAAPASATSGSLSASNTPGFPALNGTQIVVSVTANPGASVAVTAVMTVAPATGTWQDGTGGSGSRTQAANATAGSPVAFTFPEYKKKSNNDRYTWTVTITAPGFPTQVLTGSW